MSDIHKRHIDGSSLSNSLNYNPLDEGDVGLLPISKQKSSDTFNSTNDSFTKPSRLKPVDRRAFMVLVVLYLLQGVPVGLAFGSIPFILKSKLTYSQVGIFSLAAYPYSLKLLWSPIVDAIYSPKIGRRKSWIIPIQILSGFTLIYLGSIIDELLIDPQQYLSTITFVFFLLVLFCATQDIAVDGWALTCLSRDSLSYASIAQTIGINSGYFMSFTIFLALNSSDFANRYLRQTPLPNGLFTLGQYLRFWGFCYLVVTGLLFLVPEDPPHLLKENQARIDSEKAKVESIYNRVSKVDELKNIYSSMYQVLQLPNVRTFMIILLTAKIGFQANEAATNLKLLEKGLSKEDLSITVLIDFPFELIFGVYAARWSSGNTPLKPWIYAFGGRLFAAFFAQIIVFFIPTNGKISTSYFILIIIQHLMNSFMSTIQFVSLCAFNTKIADPAIGGTYMTTLNTLSNYGGTWPRLIVLFLIDKLTFTRCRVSQASYPIKQESDRENCKSISGRIVLYHDGYYSTNMICIMIGIYVLLWAKRKIEVLQNLPPSAWRVNKN